MYKRQVLRGYIFKHPVTVTVDASETGIGGILEQLNQPVLCVSRRLNKAERNYSQTHKEALAIVWTVKKLHKFLFGRKFSIISDHNALKFIFNPTKTPSKCSSAMLTRWAVALSAYNYNIEHKPGKNIPQADYLSRYSHFENATGNIDSYFLKALPITRNELIIETKRYYGPIMSSLKNGWSSSNKRKFSHLYKRREQMTLLPDNVIYVSEVPLIPPSCRKQILEYLRSAHLGAKKTISLGRTTCFWPQLQNDLRLSKGIILRCLGDVMYELVDVEDGTVHARHKDQVHFSEHFQNRKLMNTENEEVA